MCAPCSANDRVMPNPIPDAPPGQAGSSAQVVGKDMEEWKQFRQVNLPVTIMHFRSAATEPIVANIKGLY